MSEKVDVAVKLPWNMKVRLETLARETAREQDRLVEQAVERFLDTEEQHLHMIRKAVDTAENHPESLIDDASVETWVGSLGTGKEIPPPQMKP